METLHTAPEATAGVPGVSATATPHSEEGPWGGTGEARFRRLRIRWVWHSKGYLYLETQEYKTDPDLFPSISN